MCEERASPPTNRLCMKWVRTEDSTPPSGENLLICVNDRWRGKYIALGHYHYEYGFHHDINSTNSGCRIGEEVTHWQKLETPNE